MPTLEDPLITRTNSMVLPYNLHDLDSRDLQVTQQGHRLSHHGHLDHTASTLLRDTREGVLIRMVK